MIFEENDDENISEDNGDGDYKDDNDNDDDDDEALFTGWHLTLLAGCWRPGGMTGWWLS